MRPGELISAAISAATERGGPALVGFLTAGFPTRRGFRDNLLAVAGACDVVEIGVPFSDPMADGSTIQRASFAALADGVTLPWILDELAALPRPLRAPLLLMSYLNPLLAYGLDALPRAARAAGVAGFIVPDLPHEESGELKAALEREGLALVQMVTPVTPDALREMRGRRAPCSAYSRSMPAPPANPGGGPDEVLAYMDRVKRYSTVPVCAGFGIRSRDQVARFAQHVDGVVVGSALVETLERGGDVRAFLGSLRS